MLTQYFMQSTNTQEKWQCILIGGVFSHVGRLSLSGFDKMSEAVRLRETGKSPAERQNKKKGCRLYACPCYMSWAMCL